MILKVLESVSLVKPSDNINSKKFAYFSTAYELLLAIMYIDGLLTYLTLALSTPIPKLIVATMTGTFPSIQSVWFSSLSDALSPAWKGLAGRPFRDNRPAISAHPSRVLQ